LTDHPFFFSLLAEAEHPIKLELFLRKQHTVRMETRKSGPTRH
jgi:hypothetical protein